MGDACFGHWYRVHISSTQARLDFDHTDIKVAFLAILISCCRLPVHVHIKETVHMLSSVSSALIVAVYAASYH